ncbi:MAG: hypothetical protein ACLSAH_09580 [Bilophila wadsworthia]
MPDFIDKQYYSLPCPNGVVDLRTGDLRDGRPEDYLLNACLTEYARTCWSLKTPARRRTLFCSGAWTATSGLSISSGGSSATA